MPVKILGRQRLLEPGEVERLVVARPADGLGDGEALVGVDHDLEGRAQGLSYGAQSRIVLADMGAADLDLEAGEAGLARFQRVVDQFLGGEIEPGRPRCCRPGMLRWAPPAITCSGRPARLQRMSHSAVSIADSARLTVAPTALAWVRKNRPFQISSIRSGSRPISHGAM